MCSTPRTCCQISSLTFPWALIGSWARSARSWMAFVPQLFSLSSNPQILSNPLKPFLKPFLKPSLQPPSSPPSSPPSRSFLKSFKQHPVFFALRITACDDSTYFKVITPHHCRVFSGNKLLLSFTWLFGPCHHGIFSQLTALRNYGDPDGVEGLQDAVQILM
ncbi:hypothetical protein B0H11DRAFT_2321628 [Mycena galericulata]|nr:hypothetical protein B0H11DRAFT_2321628 [Mycena galericulata]